ncbi:MAG: hypothetical protein HYU39_04955 [Thaumarchaeota archaeon]|nr:hypothetical protein [Nitrososphaerota archaeon]
MHQSTEYALQIEDKGYSRNLELPYKLERKAFNKIVVEAINEGLSSLGEPFREVVLFHVRKFSGISDEDLPDRLDQFHQALFAIFGAGSLKLEMVILDRLFSKLDLPFDSKRASEFAIKVAEAKRLAALFQHPF